jgi:hypothetical protein
MAHIRHIAAAFGAAQPTLSRARQQAEKNKYPYFIAITSTPNSSVGVGKWFYDMHQFAINAKNVFDEKDLFISEANEIINNPERNGFIRIKYHWSEDPTKDVKWYNEQCRELNFDQRMINQELDLLFIGGTNCIFEDDFLSSLEEKTIVQRIRTPHQTFLNLYVEEIDVGDFILISVDTAKSLIGDFNAIEVFTYLNFYQIAEYFGKLGSLTKYSDVVKAVTKYFAKINDNKVILCIEENSIGTAVIENLQNDEEYDYEQFIYSPDPEKRVGINTSSKTKPLMISMLYDYLISNPKCIRSSDLINQLHLIERKAGGGIAAQSGKNDDLFMSSALAAYVRKLSELEILPLIDITKHKHTVDKQINQYRQAIQTLTGPQHISKGNLDIVVTDNKIEYVDPFLQKTQQKQIDVLEDNDDFLFKMF